MKVTTVLESFRSQYKDRQTITLNEVLLSLHEKSFAIMLILLTMVSALPIPAVGYSTPFGIIISVIGFQLILQKKTLHLPSRFGNKELTTVSLFRHSRWIHRVFSFIERFLRPRLTFMFAPPFSTLTSLLIFLAGASMIIPLPGTNTVPSLSILLMAIGMLDDDGVILLLGIVTALFSFMVTFLIVTLGVNLLDYLFSFVQAML